jgi:O-antigen ligase
MQKKLNRKNIVNLLFLFSILLIPFYFFRFNILSIPTTLYEIVLYISFATTISLRFSYSKLKTSFIIAGLILVIVALFSALCPNGSVKSLGIWRAYFFDGLILTINYTLLKKQLDKKIIVRGLIFSSTLAAVIAIILFVLGTKTIDGRLLDLDMISPNYLSLYLSSIIVLATVYIAEVERKNIFLVCATFVMLVALYLTYSRGGVVAIIVALAFYLVSKINKANKFKNIVYILLAVAFVVGGYFLFRPNFGSHGRVGNSSNIRFYIWETTLEIIGQNPIVGVGLNNYQTYFSELTKDRINYPEYISPQALTAHNLYLHLIAIGGPLFLLAFIFLIYKSKFYKSENYLKYALLSLFIYGFFDTPIFRNDLSAVFWLIIALSIQGISKDENSN